LYTSVRNAPELPAGEAGEVPAGPNPGQQAAHRVSGAVVAMGFVSFFTDTSAEMVTAVLPLYLLLQVGLTPLAYGVVDGIYQGVTVLVRILGGYAADRWRRPKLVCGIGYGLSAVTKLGLLGVGSAASISGLLAVDRTGKGLRTAPRDAIIASSTEPAGLGRAFGVHRAMDTAGAMLGPLIAVGLLAAVPRSYNSVFVTSFAFAVIGLAVLLLFAPDVRWSSAPGPADGAPARSKPSKSKPRQSRPGQSRPRQSKPGQRRSKGRPDQSGSSKRGPGTGKRGRSAGEQRASLRGIGGLLTDRRLLLVTVVAGVLALVTVSDSFVYLTLQKKLAAAAEVFPLFAFGSALAYLVLAVPFGRLADRIGRRTVFVGGHISLLGCYLVLLAPVPALVACVGALALLGTYYAATDGVLSATAAEMLPAHLRTSGLAVVQSAVAAGRLLSSLVFGFAWTMLGSQTSALGIFAVALAVAIPIGGSLLGLSRRPAAGTRAARATPEKSPADRAPADRAPGDTMPGDRVPTDRVPSDEEPADEMPTDA
jgi:MFS family permease